MATVRAMSVQRVVLDDMIEIEFVGDGCALPSETKRAIFNEVLNIWDKYQRRTDENSTHNSTQTGMGH